MSLGYYILDSDNNPIPAANMDEWSAWKSQNKERCLIAKTHICGLSFVVIATIFLGEDFEFPNIDTPHLFATGITRNGRVDIDGGWLYATYEKAVAGHAQCVEAAKVDATYELSMEWSDLAIEKFKRELPPPADPTDVEDAP